MKRILKYLTVMLTILSCSTNKVNADTYNDYMLKKSDKVPDVYVTKLGPEVNTYDYMYIIKRASDNQFVYCIQPGVSINEETLYEGFAYNQAAVAQLTEEQWQRITLLSYYGYGYVDEYVNHTDKKWYAVTQYLIWQVEPYGQEIFFADKLQGKKIDIFEEEMAELNRLVDNHLTLPSFSNVSKDMIIGETITLTDNNSMLANYDIESVSDNISVSKNLNNLYITAKGVGTTKLTLTRNATKYNTPPIVYNAPGTQRILARGNVDPFKINLNINIVGGKVSINKLDSETNTSKPQLSDANLSGAIYDVFDENYNLITTLTTDKNAYAESDNILAPNKTYILKERKSSSGYLLDTQEYRFTLNNNLHVHLNVKENIMKRKVDIYKVYASNETGIMTPEPNITFDIYLKSNNQYYTSITTNRSGFATVMLPFGTWIFKQTNSTQYYEKVEDFEVIIQNNNNEPITKIISNAEITSKLRVIKVDENSQKVLVRDGIKFQIRNTDTNEFVCQHITYPSETNLCVFETTDGTFTTPYALSLGNYEILELEEQTIEGYVWNSKPLKFSINEKSNFIYDKDYGVMLEVKFENKQVKGEFEVNKIGEDYIIEDNKFVYIEKPLDNVNFDLYANEDIYSQDGTLIFKDKELIKSFKITNGKYLITDMYLGKYCLYEKSTDDNHILIEEPYCFEIKYADQYTEIVKLSKTFKNYLKKSDFEFNKLDFSTSEPIPNTTIEIYMETKNEDILIGTYITDENGSVIIKDMPVIKNTKFYILEKNPAEGYVLNEEKMYFSFNENGEVIKSTMLNEKITSKIKIVKVDEEGNRLAGVKIGIYDLDGNEKGIYTTNEFGEIEVELDYDNYMYKELETLEGYVLDENEYYFNVTKDGELIELELVNEKITSKIKIVKVDEEGNRLAGVKIGIYDLDGNEIGIYTTNELGEIEVELDYNNYMYKELETLEGFVLDQNEYYFNVTKDGELIELELVNDFIEIEVPNTSSNSYIILIPIAMLMAGTSLIFINKKRKKVKNEKNR